MKDSSRKITGSIPYLGRTIVICGGSLLIWSLVVMVLSRVSLALGVIVWLLGTAGLTAGISVGYARLMKNNLELDRACRTRLLEKYLSGDVPPEGDLTEALPGLKNEYFAVAMLQCIDFSGYLPQCGQEHIPHTEFQKVDDWMRHHIAEYLEPICTPYFVPMTDGMIVLINITGLHIDSLDESSRENVRAICQGLEHAIEALKSHGLICGAVVSTASGIVPEYKEAVVIYRGLVVAKSIWSGLSAFFLPYTLAFTNHLTTRNVFRQSGYKRE